MKNIEELEKQQNERSMEGQEKPNETIDTIDKTPTVFIIGRFLSNMFKNLSNKEILELIRYEADVSENKPILETTLLETTDNHAVSGGNTDTEQFFEINDNEVGCNIDSDSLSVSILGQ